MSAKLTDEVEDYYLHPVPIRATVVGEGLCALPQPLVKPPLVASGRDALKKQAGGLFLAKAGSNL